MVGGSGFHNRQSCIALKIRSLLISLTEEPLEYDKITPKIEYWIEYVLREEFATVDELVEGISHVAWDNGGSYGSVARFLKEFSDTPSRSEGTRSFVCKLGEHVLRWFAIAATEDLYAGSEDGTVASGGGVGFVRAASFVGHLINRGLVSDDLVRRHLVKPLIAHHTTDLVSDVARRAGENTRAIAVYQLFIAAGNALFHGLLEPDDARVCFETLDAQISLGMVAGFDVEKLREFRETHTAWLEQKKRGDQRSVAETGRCEEEEEPPVAEAPAEIETPVAFAPRELPTINIGIPSHNLQTVKPSSTLHDAEPSSQTFTDVPVSSFSSPTFSISTVSDLTPTELEIGHSEEQATTRHDTFYFEDGNVEIVCGDTVFRVHSTTISFSSPKLRDILSPSSILLNASMPEGCPRVAFTDNTEDFAVLLKMIYTPGFPARHEVPKFSVFASLLRMTAKYGFSDVRDQLVKDLNGAYPAKWEGYLAAEVLGEGVFGSPTPHPNAVLNLFVAQNIRSAIPFAAYRASLGGFPSLMSDEPDTMLPRRVLAATTYSRGEIRQQMARAAHTIVYERYLLWVCPDRGCVLNVGVKPMDKRMEALTKLHEAMAGEREGGVLSSPPWGDLLCVECVKDIEGSHAVWSKACWKLLPAAFSVAKVWDEV